MTIVPTGPIDPDYYRNQADRAARAMALFIASRRRKKEDELEKARASAFEAAKGILDGSLPADAASVQARIEHYRQLDPEGASDLDLKLQFHTDTRKALNTVRQAQLAAPDAERAAALTRAILAVPEDQREAVIRMAGFTDEDFKTPKPPVVPEPQTFQEAIMQGVTGRRPMGQAQALGAVIMGNETKAAKAEAEKQAMLRAERRADEIERQEQAAVTYRQNRDYAVSHPVQRAAGATRKGKGATDATKEVKPVTAKEVTAATARYKDIKLKDIGVNARELGWSPAQVAAEEGAAGRMKGLADSLDVAAAKLVRGNLDAAIAEHRSIVEELAQTEAELVQIHRLQ